MSYRNHVKRPFDALSAAVLLLALSPLLLLSGLLVVATSAGPMFFLQDRLGLHGRRFRILKFRTMMDAARDPTQQVLAGHAELTAVGKVMRRLKIDELPQLINVLLGDMSLVGPRPCLPETGDSMPGWARVRFDVAPGLTGLAQVHGNVSLSWEERWHYDVQYVQHCSFVLDWVIMGRTVLVVAQGEERFRSRP